EIDRRYANVRAALEAAGLDAVVVCGSEYTGFEGAVTYLSGFVIVHRYAYVLLPRDGDPAIVFPAEARYVGEHGTTWIAQQGFHAFREAYAPGRTAAEVLAPAEQLFVERGCGRLTMNMVLVGPEFAIARADTTLGEFCIPSLEIAGPGGHWVEVSRALGTPGD